MAKTEIFSAVIPAAGLGKRMQESFPGVAKALLPVGKRPMIRHVLEAIEGSGVADEIVVVLGPGVERQMREALKQDDVRFAYQQQPRGTGDATLCAHLSVSTQSTNVLVLFADQPLLSSESLKSVVDRHLRLSATVTMLTVTLDDFSEWRSAFTDWGRIIRHPDGRFKEIIEAKDATPRQLGIAEVNPSVYCFRADWLWPNLAKLETANAQREYLLTDVVGIAASSGLTVETVAVEDPRETLGANTPTQLEILNKVYLKLPFR